MRYRFHTADVFTDQIFGGNPLAVFPQAGGLKAAQMQKVAAEFNFSETTFVFPPETSQGTRRLRIFTPKGELPFAGHPTVGTAHVLSAIGDIPLSGGEANAVFEEGVGAVPVTIRGVGGKPTYAELTAPQLPEFGPEPPPLEQLAALLSLEVGDLLLGEYGPQAVSCGVPFLFLPLRDREALARVRLDRQRWQDLLADFWAPSLYLFCADGERSGVDWRARMFAPAMGIEEDPATGSAATALAGYLGSRHAAASGQLRWLVEQGVEMGRPSLLQVEADKVEGTLGAIRVGGASVLVSEGTMEIPEA